MTRHNACTVSALLLTVTITWFARHHSVTPACDYDLAAVLSPTGACNTYPIGPKQQQSHFSSIVHFVLIERVCEECSNKIFFFFCTFSQCCTAPCAVLDGAKLGIFLPVTSITQRASFQCHASIVLCKEACHTRCTSWTLFVCLFVLFVCLT